MRVVLSNSSGVPLYQQIKEQIGAAILSGDLAEDTALPSVRALARDLRISIITTNRAYTELAAEGFIATVPGKGAYVLPLDSALVREQLLRQVEDGLQTALDAARRAGLGRADLVEILDGLMQAERQENPSETGRNHR
ncbi:GntR family transcriptional regulator [Streptomyces cocklensis]|uniref:GntR family transcriptional regulator n=1 Tax=Actinacidiphila cocklensis TaxID=887465 RepID=A0A9W4GNX3_9ACTN|nr:GntR family transcriptional regulator [Actinacidiphila cocklensis]MDD1060194.1 GntR family transcriptional regulator [Actinacidiphila cocklensis]WSX76626.1 GntR family transcriptional regulator [Streptomyces sp. NBC_00899]CAG6391783.1 GntR family transcriptional regulator [Actinacidiphila cocklensis]